MSRRRTPSLLLAAALLGGGLLAAVPPGGQPSSDAGSATRAVVALRSAAALDDLASHGVRVISVQRSLGTAVVETRSVGLLHRLVDRGVLRSAHSDVALHPTSKDSASKDSAGKDSGSKAEDDDDRDDDNESSAPSTAGVFAWSGLASPAGRTAAGAGTTVALVDTGVADTGALSRSSGRLVDGVDTSGEGTLQDRYGHGTFMAGLIAGGRVEGTGDRSLGVAPGSRVLNVKVADQRGETSLSKVLQGFDWLLGEVRNGRRVDVVSFSFSRARPGEAYGPDPLTDAVEAIRDAGVSVVVSAGNVPGEVGDPGFHPRVISVGAADLTRRKPTVAAFSGGATVAGVVRPDVVANGVHVLGLLPPASMIAKNNPQSRHGALWRGSGTSQATASTAGVAAIFRAAYPAATPREVKASLRAAAGKVSGNHAGAGLLQVAKKLRDGTDGPSTTDGGGDGEGGFDAGSWSAGSWSAGSWSAGSWSAGSWSAGSWSSFWGTDGSAR